MRLNGLVNNPSPVQTTDGETPVTIVTFTPSAHGLDNCVGRVHGALIGKDSSNNSVTLEVASTFRVVAGTVTLRGSVVARGSTLGDAGLLGVVADLTVIGSGIALRATGEVATTINWTGYVDAWTTEV